MHQMYDVSVQTFAWFRKNYYFVHSIKFEEK